MKQLSSLLTYLKWRAEHYLIGITLWSLKYASSSCLTIPFQEVAIRSKSNQCKKNWNYINNELPQANFLQKHNGFYQRKIRTLLFKLTLIGSGRGGGGGPGMTATSCFSSSITTVSSYSEHPLLLRVHELDLLCSPLILLKYSDGLINLLESPVVPGKLGGTNGSTRCLFTSLVAASLVCSSTSRLMIVRSEQEELSRFEAGEGAKRGVLIIHCGWFRGVSSV